jgi:hypothetical protein
MENFPSKEYHFFNQAVRDLSWVIFSPPLITGISDSGIRFLNKLGSDEEAEFFQQLLFDLEKNPQELLKYLEKKNSHLLGKYFEALFEFYLYKSPFKELIASNIQINSNGKSIGELDFIYRDLIEDKIIHLETAGKFFITNRSNDGKVQFLGPNPNDSLQEKLDKISSTQITLTKTEEGKEALRKLGISEKIFPRALFKGYIFYLKGIEVKTNFLNPNHLKRKAIRLQEIEYLGHISDRWKILDRKEWVSPFATREESILNETDTVVEKIKKYFRDDNYPLLISQISEEEGCFFEKERYFVLSGNWPEDFNNGRV